MVYQNFWRLKNTCFNWLEIRIACDCKYEYDENTSLSEFNELLKNMINRKLELEFLYLKISFSRIAVL